jgi:hypothetical protein
MKIGFKIPYRTVQGIVRGLSYYVRIRGNAFYTYEEEEKGIKGQTKTIYRRVELSFENDDCEPITLIVDASGLSV